MNDRLFTTINDKFQSAVTAASAALLFSDGKKNKSALELQIQSVLRELQQDHHITGSVKADAPSRTSIRLKLALAKLGTASSEMNNVHFVAMEHPALLALKSRHQRPGKHFRYGATIADAHSGLLVLLIMHILSLT